MDEAKTRERRDDDEWMERKEGRKSELDADK
jgi:hypothetical protein